MTLTFDILLLFYDNPVALHNWMARLLLQTDYMQFADRSEIIICDTGSPRDRIEDNLQVVRRWAPYKRAIYLRAGTDEIRAALAKTGTHARPSASCFNISMREISQADVVVHSVVSNVFLPNYFGQMLALHQANSRIFLQPKQYRLHSPLYHRLFYDQSIQRALASGTIEPCNGLPDFSVRREHVLAIGGWDEDYVSWGMSDIDLCSRLCGMIDFPVPAHEWHQNAFGQPREPYNHYGLTHCMPDAPALFSLICKDYPNYLPDNDSSRVVGVQETMPIYLKKWGQIQRNQGRPKLNYEVYDVAREMPQNALV
jgi:hypothetical protein